MYTKYSNNTLYKLSISYILNTNVGGYKEKNPESDDSTPTAPQSETCGVNRIKIKLYSKEYYKKNKNRILQKQKLRYHKIKNNLSYKIKKDNTELIEQAKIKKALYDKEYTKNKKEKIKKYKKEYYQKNKDKISHNRKIKNTN